MSENDEDEDFSYTSDPDEPVSHKRTKSNDQTSVFSPKMFLDKGDPFKLNKRSSRDRNSIGTSDFGSSTRTSLNAGHRASMGGGHHHHPSQPLYTLPNAFKYDIKLRDANTNIGNIVDSTHSPHLSTDNRSSMSMSMVLGSRERRSDIRHITDRLSVQGLQPLGSDGTGLSFLPFIFALSLIT
jgi:hypothetical protein